MKSDIIELGYLGLRVANFDAWRSYACEIIGMEWCDDEETPDRAYLRMDNWHHRIALHRGSEEDLTYLGFRVAGPRQLDNMRRTLDEAGIPYSDAPEALLRERHVIGMLSVVDPAGINVEIFYGPQVDSWKPFHPGRAMFGKFVTGDQGLGHCIIRNHGMRESREFYEVLGFEGAVEYRLPTPDNRTAELTFMHINDRQHSVAFGPPMQRAINHLMIEYTDIKDMFRAHDIIRRRGIDVAVQIGMHCNDEALSFYAANPSKWLWEMGWNGRKPPLGQEYYTRDLIGHALEAGGYGLDVDLTSPSFPY